MRHCVEVTEAKGKATALSIISRNGKVLTIFLLMKHTRAHNQTHVARIRIDRKRAAYGCGGIIRTAQHIDMPNTQRNNNNNNETGITSRSVHIRFGCPNCMGDNTRRFSQLYFSTSIAVKPSTFSFR